MKLAKQPNLKYYDLVHNLRFDIHNQFNFSTPLLVAVKDSVGKDVVDIIIDRYGIKTNNLKEDTENEINKKS